MSHSTKARPKSEADFPLWQRKDGRWCRKIKGRVHYFGTDRQAALDEWLRVKDYLLAGRTPPTEADADALTLETLVNKYLEAKQSSIETGEYSDRSFRNAFLSCERFILHFGRRRLVSDIHQTDFAAYRTSLVESKYSPSTINLEVALCRGLFNWGYASELIDRPVRFGPQFKGISKKTTRRKNGKTPPKMFEPSEIKAMIDAASPQLKAMILLGINAGFGNTDCAQLPKSAVDLKGCWIEFPRPKTGVERRVHLWPETVQAFREAIKERPQPKSSEDGELVFITPHGLSWVHLSPSKPNDKRIRFRDMVGVAFSALTRKLRLQQPGRGFYSLRRTHRTIADETGDWPAVNHIMGHVDPTMGGVYRQRISDERLQAVSDHVRAWLFGE